MARLIQWGHNPRDVWAMTPAQIVGYQRLGVVLRKTELAEVLSIQATAARADTKGLKKRMKELQDDG